MSKFDFDKIKEDIDRVKKEKPAYEKSDNYRLKEKGNVDSPKVDKYKKIKELLKKKK